MNRIAILCERDRAVLQEFSRRCTGRLKANVFVGLVLPLAREFLDANVEKEIRKDRMAIEYAGALSAAGKPLCDTDIEVQFERTKSVDRRFLEALPGPLASLAVEHERFAPIRKQRLHLVMSTVLSLLSDWSESRGFREAVAGAYPEPEFRNILSSFFHLYIEEVKILGATAVPSLPARLGAETLLAKLFMTMEAASGELIDHCLGEIYD